jgi:hypothetical protein
MKGIISLVLVCLLLHSFSLNAQNSFSTEELINHTLEIYSADPLLSSGILYYPEHQIAHGHPWLFTENWQAGTIYASGREYLNQQVKYDLISNGLILRTLYNSSNFAEIVLNRSVVDSCKTGTITFINGKYLPNGPLEMHFPGICTLNGDTIIADYNKRYLPTYFDAPPYGKYTATSRSVYFIYNGEYIDISQRRDLLGIFNENRKAIKKAIKKKGKRYDSLTPNEILQIIHSIKQIKQ